MRRRPFSTSGQASTEHFEQCAEFALLRNCHLGALAVTVLGRGGPHAAGVWIMSRVVAVTACGFMLAACSATMPSLSLDFMKPAPQAETLALESEPPGAEAKTSLGESCRTPCKLSAQPGSEFSVTLTLSGYQPQTVSVRPEADGAVAVPRLAPNPVHVDLQAVAPPKRPVPKKKKPAEATGGDAAGRAPGSGVLHWSRGHSPLPPWTDFPPAEPTSAIPGRNAASRCGACPG